MGVEAIRTVTEIEEREKERRAAAEAEARKLVADAQRTGVTLLEKVRKEAADDGVRQLRRAEERAAGKTAEIARLAEGEADALRETAKARLEEAAAAIVDKIVDG